MATVGYIRVSDASQNEGRQLEGVVVDRTFTDKVSGKDTNRPALVQMLEYIREGDTLLVHSIDRLARNLVDLRNLVDQITGKGVKVQFLKENLTFSADTSNPMNNLMLSMMGAFAEFERAVIRERQREGIELAKAEGRMKGRPAALTQDQVKSIKARVQQGESKVALAAEFKVTRSTLYAALKA